MKAIAKEAGVSEKTMYLAFATKATLLRQVIQLAVQGDEAGTPLAQRPEWRALLAGPVEEVFTRFARLNAALMTRTAAIIALGEAAASTDPELAEHRDRAHAETRANLPRPRSGTPATWCATPRCQRTARSRRDVCDRHRRRNLPATDQRMRLEPSPLRRPHRPHAHRGPRPVPT